MVYRLIISLIMVMTLDSELIAEKAEAFDPVKAYAEQVVSGAIVAGEPVRLQCQRHLDDLVSCGDRGLYFDLQAAMKPVYWIAKNITFNEGEFAGKPFIPDRHQIFIIGSAFGWRRIETGYRRFTYIYFETGKGNGKSPLLAALGIYCLSEDNEPNAMVLTAAVVREQAKIIFNDAVAFVEANPDLDKKYNSTKNYIHYKARPGDQSQFIPVSSQARNLHGKRPSIIFIDEYHEHPDDTVEDSLKKGFKHRRQPLMFITTNAGNDLNTACGRWHQRCMNILRGIFADDEVFVYICSLDKGDDFMDESCWPKTNPLIGNGYNVDYLRRQVREAIQMPSKLAGVMRFGFCVWTAQGESWLDPVKWDKLAEVMHEKDLAGKAWGEAIDLSDLHDVTALVRLFPLDDGRLYIKPKFFLPESVLRRDDEPDLVKTYQRWASEGMLPNDHPEYEPWLNIMKGEVIDHDEIVLEVLADIEKYGRVGEPYNVPFDKYHMKQPANKIESAAPIANMLKCDQGFSFMTEPCMLLEQKIFEKTIVHDGNPMMSWMIGNTVLNENNRGLVHPDKKRSTQKIDGVSALLMDIGCYEFPEEDNIKMSIYDDPNRDVGFRKLEW